MQQEAIDVGTVYWESHTCLQRRGWSGWLPLQQQKLWRSSLLRRFVLLEEICSYSSASVYWHSFNCRILRNTSRKRYFMSPEKAYTAISIQLHDERWLIRFVSRNQFDARKGPTWHCIVGRNFGSFVTHGSLSLSHLFTFSQFTLQHSVHIDS